MSIKIVIPVEKGGREKMDNVKMRKFFWNNPAFSMLNFILLLLSAPVLLLVDIMVSLLDTKSRIACFLNKLRRANSSLAGNYGKTYID